jgi:hypothetical protein
MSYGAFAAAPAGNFIYVSPTGSDTNTGQTTAAPFKTFKQALTVAVPGDTIFARGGTYSEKIVISGSGTPRRPITLKNVPGETPVLDGTGLSADYDGMINLTNKNYIIIDGFEIRNLKSNSDDATPIGISVYGTGTGIQLLNNRIHNIESPNGNAHGIRVYGTSGTLPISDITISYNEINNCKLGQSEALVLNGNVDGFKVNYNKVHDNDNIGIDFIGYEGTAPNNDYARNGECVGNLVYNISSAKNPTYGGDTSAGGIYVDGGANILIDRNIIKYADIGIEVATEQGPVVKNITVTNNLITDCEPQAGISFGAYEGSRGGGVENLKVFNNTLYNNTYAVQIQRANSPTNMIKNNIFYGGKAVTGTIGSNVFSGNITANPLFVNPAAGDFRLKAGSPAIDVGTEVYGKVDLAGSPRQSGAKVDAGAYEYQWSSPPQPLVSVMIGAEKVVFDNHLGFPFIDAQNRTQVPFRAVLEKFGCTVDWDAAQQIAVAKKGSITVQVPIGEDYILINGVKMMNDTTAQIINSRTYVPIRVVLEAFGATVTWDQATYTVLVQ